MKKAMAKLGNNILKMLKSTTFFNVPNLILQDDIPNLIYFNMLSRYIVTLFLFPPTDGTQKEAVPGREPPKNCSGARQCRPSEKSKNWRIICRRRQELGVSAQRMAWLFKYRMLLSYPIVHDPCILSLAGSAEPSFGWYKVISRSYLAATPTIRRSGAPKRGT